MKTSFIYLLGLFLLCCFPYQSWAQSACIGDIEPKASDICEGDIVSISATNIELWNDEPFRLRVTEVMNISNQETYYGCDDPGVLFLSVPNSDLYDLPPNNPQDPCANPSGFSPFTFSCTNGVSTQYKIEITWKAEPSGNTCTAETFVTVHCLPEPEVSADPDLACVGDLIVYCVDNPQPGVDYVWYNGLDVMDSENGCTDPIPYDPADGIYVVADDNGCSAKAQPVVYLSNGCTPNWCEDNIVVNSTLNLTTGTCNPGEYFDGACVDFWTCSHGAPLSVSEDVNLHAKMRVKDTPNGLRGDGLRGQGTFTSSINLTGSLQIKTNGEAGNLLIVATNAQGVCDDNPALVPAFDPNTEELLWTVPLTGNTAGEWITANLNTIVLTN